MSVKSSRNVESDSNLMHQRGPKSVPGKQGSAPVAHLPDLMHLFSVKSTIIGIFDRVPENGTISVLANWAIYADLTDVFQKERKKETKARQMHENANARGHKIQ